MASTFVRSVARISSSSIRSRVSNASSAAARPFSLPAPSPSTSASSRIRRVAFVSRTPVELGSCGGASLFPLHSAVAAARLTSRLSTTSRSCRALTQEMGLSVRR
ncbi:protein NUCLEAR FUSION DEFECTIVE 6, chloroplastic/mitochondrial-like isoform X1 [Ananas comosus]|uniref:Protein NUCLEAR FUSION DEFECTIVE 6, chloroplastic/mitochondrial-like isoform X1 n=1 Tax=Ananas comosus TaxID=4615 RepID=A0A6P5EQ04_ANACO|nr:protein NUCLEAR FUSION DEFECTIVE 6, chloroplastic/mitochondrial-like isoform X1 [Ananas comosus]